MRASEAWLRDYQNKLAGLAGEILPALPDRIEFDIPCLLNLPNRTSGQHWGARVSANKKLATLVGAATMNWRNMRPMERAKVTVTRYSVGTVRPDWDNLYASAKALIDLLLLRSTTHPHSFGLIVDDDQTRLVPVMFSERVKARADQRTHVLIERIYENRL